MRLQLQEAVDDLDAGALQLVRPADVGLLVETRLQFDHRGDRLAGLRRFGQLAHNRAVLAGAVQGLLDRDDSGVARCLAQELDDDVEALIGVMDNDVLLTDRREAIAAEIADALGKARVIGGEDEIRTLVGDQLSGVVQSEDALIGEYVAWRRIELLAQETPQIGRHPSIDPEVDDMTAAATFQRGFEQSDKVLGLFLDLDLAVAQHAEDALCDDGESRKQMIEKQRDHLLDRQESNTGPGQADEPIYRSRDQAQRLQADVVGE